MVNSLHLLHYESLSEFKRAFYRELLTIEHLAGDEIFIKKAILPDAEGIVEDDEFNFWGHVLKKDGIKYLLPTRGQGGRRYAIKELLPLLAKDMEKVSYRGEVYWLIKKPIVAKFKAEKRHTFKQLVDILADIPHSNPIHRKLLTFMAFASMLDKANFRVSTPPAFGKDSIVDTVGNLFGDAATTENPTIAKLEYMTCYKWLVVNEVVDIPIAEWRRIEQFLLAVGAHKPEVTKHSRAYGNVQEVLDISNFSLALMYNDADCYPEPDKYLDFVAKDAVLDRFPPFRLFGRFEANFNEIRRIDVPVYVEKNMDDYKALIHSFSYYKANLNSCLHHYSIQRLRPLKQRWNLNVGKLLKIIDLYCDSQEEFDEWIKVVNASINDYQDMIDYIKGKLALFKKFEKESLRNEKLMNEKIAEINDATKDKNTFAEKMEVLKEYRVKKKVSEDVKDVDFWGETK